MRNSINFVLSCFVGLCVLACSSEAVQEKGGGQSQDQTTLVVLSSPMDGQDLMQVLRQQNVFPRELVVESKGGMQAGYSPRADESLDEALESFKGRLAQKLAFIHHSVTQETANASPNETEEVSTMRARLLEDIIADQDDVETNELHVTRMRVVQGDDEILAQSLSFSEVTPIVNTRPSTPQEPGLKTLSTSHETWAPYAGTSQVTQNQTYQTFYFNNVTQFTANSASTYEHETQVYNVNYADYNNLWVSNLPHAYFDTPFWTRSIISQSVPLRHHRS